MTELRWIASSSASALYAAAQLVRGKPLADARLAAAIEAPAAELAAALADLSVPPEVFFEHLLALAAGIENNRDLVSLALRRATGVSLTEGTVSRLAATIAVIELGFRQAFTASVAEIELRSGPLREQWEARGPGLLAAIGRATDPALIADRADVIVVQPARGGAGRAFLAYNTVLIEAVLTNPLAELPEVVRLGWLIAQLQMDLPKYNEGIARARLPWIAGLALLPAAVAAAEYVELARSGPETLRLALAAWHVGDSAPFVDFEQPEWIETVAAILERWWEAHCAAPTSWAAATAALDRMLGQGES